MSAKEQSKASKKPTNKDKDLSESVQWLLDFVNLGCKPGVLLLKRLHEEVKINCPPKEPSAFRTLLIDYTKGEESLAMDKECSIEDQLERKLKSIALKEHKGIYSKRFIDINGNEWVETVEGKFLFVGNENDFPNEEEIKVFLRETGIQLPQNQTAMRRSNGKVFSFVPIGASRKVINTKYWNIIMVWRCVKYALGTMQEGMDIDPIQVAYSQSFVTECYDTALIEQPEVVVTKHYGIKYTHDNTFIQTVCAYIQDFWNNHRELHTRLKQCQCCGRFEIITGGKWVYCSKKCRERFNRKARDVESDKKASRREETKKVKELMAKKEIIELLCKHDYTEEEAVQEYEKVKSLHPTNTASLKSFKNTWFKGY